MTAAHDDLSHMNDMLSDPNPSLSMQRALSAARKHLQTMLTAEPRPNLVTAALGVRERAQVAVEAAVGLRHHITSDRAEAHRVIEDLAVWAIAAYMGLDTSQLKTRQPDIGPAHPRSDPGDAHICAGCGEMLTAAGGLIRRCPRCGRRHCPTCQPDSNGDCIFCDHNEGGSRE